MRTFAQLPLAIWSQPAFQALTDDAKIALLFIWAGPHSKSSGVSILKDGYACVDLNWIAERWKTARQELESAGLVARDELTDEVWANGYFKANKPANPRHLAAIRNQIASIQSLELKQLAETALYEIRPELNPNAIPAETISKPTALLNTSYLNNSPKWGGAV